MKYERKLDPRREAWVQKLGMKTTPRQSRRTLTPDTLEHLDRCKDDEARKVLLGIRS
jgi:hypothetical protein